jgi:glutathione S-transferase
MSQIKLYVLSGSHPCAAVEVALKRKGLPFKRVNLMPMAQSVIGPLRYGGNTVPGMRVDGERLLGSRAIMRRLDELAPQPPLLPAPGDPERARVLEVERWGDEILQSVPRRILDVAFMRRPRVMESFATDLPLPLPPALMRPTLPLMARMMAGKNDAREETARADLLALPGHLEKIDAWIAEGLLGGEEPNAADLQIGSSIQLLQTIADVRPIIGAHPAAATLTRYLPPLAGEVDAGVLPAEWLPAYAA